MLASAGDGKSPARGGSVCLGGTTGYEAVMRALPVLASLILVAGCVSKPEPKPVPQPVPPVARPAPPPAPLPPDWIDWPITPGDWRYSADARGSVAMFGTVGRDADFVLRCDRQARTMFASRSGAFPEGDSGRMTIRTSNTLKTFEVFNTGGTPPYVASRIPTTDPHLDAMAFSRGRFLVQVKGGADLVLPAWPEVSRVIEDCRSG